MSSYRQSCDTNARNKEKIDNWRYKEALSNLAAKHYTRMEDLYADQSEESYRKTGIYDENMSFLSKPRVEKIPRRIVFMKMTTVEAILRFSGPEYGKVAALNFASYKHPGGMFLKGSAAQEESLCHSSNLYNILERIDEKTSYYKDHRRLRANPLYTDSGLYTPGVLFLDENDNITKCDVITCAAPNRTAYDQLPEHRLVESAAALKSRIRYVLRIARFNEVDTIILGAYGCGVFGQNPTSVAEFFYEAFHTLPTGVSTVVFAIPDDRMKKMDRFLEFWDKCLLRKEYVTKDGMIWDRLDVAIVD